jgi:hypothetical protein
LTGYSKRTRRQRADAMGINSEDEVRESVVTDASMASAVPLSNGAKGFEQYCFEQYKMYVFAYEWEVLDKGKSFKTYWPLTHIERVVPFVHIAMYIALSVFATVNLMEAIK